MTLLQIGTSKTRRYHPQLDSHLEEIKTKSGQQLSPLFAHLYVENGCHLKCAHCYESEESHPPKHALSLDDYRDIYAQLANMGVLVLTFSGGEPFLRRDFLELVHEARKQRFAVRVYTSGTLINERKADRLKELQVSEVHVSLYHADAGPHDEFTGIPGSHAKSVRALKLLQERGIKTVLKTNVMTFNLHSLDRIIALAKTYGADYVFDPTIKPKMDGDRSPLRFAVPPEELKEFLLKRPDLEKAMSFEDADGYCNGENHRMKGDHLCAAARNLITVWADGSIAPCAFFPTAGGNVKTESIQDIWRDSPLFQEVRYKQFASMTKCGTCDVQSTCHPCMAYGLVEENDLGGCNTGSKQYATARAQLAHEMQAAHIKNTRGMALPLVGDPSFPMPDGPETSRLSAEP